MGVRDQDIEDRIERALAEQELRLLRAAHETGFFKYRVPLKELKQMFRKTVEELDPSKRSKYQRAVIAKTAMSRKTRRENDRIKILLGSYLIARLRKFPEQEPTLLAGLDVYISSAKRAETAKRNADLITVYRKTTGELAGPQANKIKLLLGAYLLTLVERMPAEKASLLAGLDAFLRADPREWAVKRDLELFADLLD